MTVTDARRSVGVTVARGVLRAVRASSRRSVIRLEDMHLEHVRAGDMDRAREAHRLAGQAMRRVMSTSETLAASRVGPVRCPDCSWDAHGTLEVVDQWETHGPPIPRPGGGAAFVVVSDDEEAGTLLECPACEEPFDPEDMVPR